MRSKHSTCETPPARAPRFRVPISARINIGISRMLLKLLHLADSALPVGAAAQSFGLETLVEEGNLTPQSMDQFLRDYLLEAGVLEASFVRRAWQGAHAQALGEEFGARRVARESRQACLTLG